MKTADFIRTETGKDLIVAFALKDSKAPVGIRTLTLLRTPMYEKFLDPTERGVSVSMEFEDDTEDEDRNVLRTFVFDRERKRVHLRPRSRTYEVDVSQVDEQEIESMCRVLRMMNFDQSIELSGV